MSSEAWKPVVGWEGNYEVSSLGRVRSVDRKINRQDGKVAFHRGKVLKSHVSPTGYHLVGLYRTPRVKMARVHRIMAEAFIPNPEQKPVVRHLNDNKTDNRIENLAWGTYEENVEDSKTNGRFNASGKHFLQRRECRRGHRYSPENVKLNRSGYRVCLICENIWKRRQELRRVVAHVYGREVVDEINERVLDESEDLT